MELLMKALNLGAERNCQAFTVNQLVCGLQSSRYQMVEYTTLQEEKSFQRHQKNLITICVTCNWDHLLGT